MTDLARPDLRYYEVVRRWLDELTAHHELDSILDVGASHSWVATWGDFRRRFALDLYRVPEIPGVCGLRGDWLELPLAGETHDLRQVSVVTCLQVLEHLRDDQIPDFTARLLGCSAHLIVSVPLFWPKGASPDHHQDPVSPPKILQWMHDRPSYRQAVTFDGYHNAALRFVGLWKGDAK